MRFVLFLAFCIPLFLHGQVTLDDTVVHDKVMVCPQYSSAWTGGDLVHRFGFMNLVGFGAGYKFRNNVFTILDANFIFGNEVKIPGIFSHLVDSYGNITDVNGDVATVSVLARGVSVNGQIGKIIPLSHRDKNSGLMIHAGAGYLNHRVKIETQTQVVPMIELDYKKGYDRLTTGVNLMQFIGYAYMPKQSFYSFYAGIYAMQGFTRNRRTLFYDQPNVPVSTDLRLDLLMGVKVGWFIPFYSTQKDYYIEY